MSNAAPARSMASVAILIAAGAFVLSFALAGCPKKKPKDPGCDATEDCKAGLVCVDQTCRQCSEDAHCGDGETCQAGACVAKPECSADADCSDGKVCKAGKCAACTGDSQCGPGGKCAAGACERATKCTVDEDCEDDEDCLDGYCQRPWQAGGTAACTMHTVYFGFDAATIEQSERDRLDGNASCLEKEAGKSVYVTGHTDQSGTEEYNIALSERRARAAADYLARLGIDPARLDVVPKGEAELTGAGDDQDRRVEFSWH